jgi:DNA-binding MarR family transcriptional regulator
MSRKHVEWICRVCLSPERDVGVRCGDRSAPVACYGRKVTIMRQREAGLPGGGDWSLLHDTCFGVIKVAERAFAEAGLTYPQVEVLAILSSREGGVRPSDLADALVVETQSITGLLDRMERSGLIRRVPNPEDRRSVFVEPTDRAREAFDRTRAMRQRLGRDLWGSVSASNLESYRRILGKLRARVMDELLPKSVPLGARARSRRRRSRS